MRNAWMSLFLVLIIIISCSFFSFRVKSEQELPLIGSAKLITNKPPPLFFSGGSGTESDPYQISNVSQLQEINEDLSAHYILVNDIDASETALWNGREGFLPIGNESDNFNGSFNGQNYEISDLFINRSMQEHIGLFGYIGTGTVISNVSLERAYSLGWVHVGGLVGYDYNGIISNCSVTGEMYAQLCVGGISGTSDHGKYFDCNTSVIITGNDVHVGGLIGYNFWGDLTRCYSLGIIKGDRSVGGLAGHQQRGNATDCFSNCEVVGGLVDTGGLFGMASSRKMIRCFATGNVSGNNNVGGLIGSLRFEIKECFSSGSVKGKSNVGGLVGLNYRIGIINSSYSTGETNGNEYVGGFVGYNEGKILYCYSFGQVIGIDQPGGLIGYNEGTNISCFWDKERSGISLSGGGIGLYTSEMKKRSTYESVDWNFETKWNIAEGSSYPYFKWFDYGSPRITSDNNETAYEDYLYSANYQADSNLPGGKGAQWSLRSNASGWLKINDKGILSGIPSNDDVGQYWVNITAFLNFGKSDFTNFTLTVLNANDPPEILTDSIGDIPEDESFYYLIEWIDIDPTIFVPIWIMETNAPFLTLNLIKGSINGTPSNDDVGSWWVFVNLSDGIGGFDEVNLSLEVLNVNDDPEIIDFEISDLLEDEDSFIDLDAIDIDPTNDTLTWSIISSASFISIDQDTGNISVIPPNNLIGSWWVNVTVSDGNGGEDWRNFTVTLLNTNDGPWLNRTDDKYTMYEDSSGVTLDLNDQFYDIDGDVLSFNYIEPENLTISVIENLFIVVPKENWFGTEIVEFTASDGMITVSNNVTFEVFSVNDPPIDVQIFSDPIFFEGGDQWVNSSAYDVDIPDGDTLNFRWSSNVTGEIGFGQSINLSLPAGYHLLTLTVTDKEGLSTNASIEIQVKPIIDDDINGKEKEFPILIVVTIGIVILLIIIGIIIFVLMSKKKPEEEILIEEEKVDLEQTKDYLSSEETYPSAQDSIGPLEPVPIIEQENVFGEFGLPVEE